MASAEAETIEGKGTPNLGYHKTPRILMFDESRLPVQEEAAKSTVLTNCEEIQNAVDSRPRYDDDEDCMDVPSGVVGVVVAKPLDETLWSGGTMVTHPDANWHVYSVDQDASSRQRAGFERALGLLGVSGKAANCPDGQDLTGLSDLEEEVLCLIGHTEFDIVITHGPKGEGNDAALQANVSAVVGRLWAQQRIRSRELWVFAYEVPSGGVFPAAIRTAHIKFPLRAAAMRAKLEIITEAYGLPTESWEASAAPCWEAFWRFSNVRQYLRWLDRQKRLP